MRVVITFDAVSKRYGERLALDSVSWHMDEGECVVVVGPSGAGKTSLLRLITHIWLTIADNEYAWPRLLRLRIYYDGYKTPSVDAPLGDFFGVGLGYEQTRVDFRRLVIDPVDATLDYTVSGMRLSADLAF